VNEEASLVSIVIEKMKGKVDRERFLESKS